MNIDLLSEFPADIKTIIHGLIKIYDEKCSDIILYGSSAQNKLTFIKDINNKYEFLSDIEFIVVPKNPENCNNKNFNKELMNKSMIFLNNLSNIKKAPFVDINSVSESFFNNAQLRISIFELKNNGLVLKGRNLLEKLPEVNKYNYNKKIQNIEVVKGLKILMLESYNWFLINDSNIYSEQHFCYFLSSSFLNILRTLLPIFDIFISDSKERVDSLMLLKNNHIIQKHFGESFFVDIQKIFKDKSKSIFNYNSKELFILNLTGYKSLLSLILDSNEEFLINDISKKCKEVFYGDDLKVRTLSLLTTFFILALNAIEKSINSEFISDNEINQIIYILDNLLESNNSYQLLNIIGKYKELEKTRWKIIGSKD